MKVWESRIIIRLDNWLYLFKLCFLLQHSFRLNELDFLHSALIVCNKTKWTGGHVVTKSGLIAGRGPWKHQVHFVSTASFTIIKHRIIFNFTEESNFTDKSVVCVCHLVWFVINIIHLLSEEKAQAWDLILFLLWAHLFFFFLTETKYCDWIVFACYMLLSSRGWETDVFWNVSPDRTITAN